MLGAIYIGLSGMNAYSRGLQTISNNVANLNSPGFKAASVNFTDVFATGGLGSAFSGRNTNFSGAGVRFGSPSIDFTQGDLRQSGGDLDLSIQGSGFMVLSNANERFYARTGQFAVNGQGHIALGNTNYVLNTFDSDGRPVPFNVDARRTQQPVATRSVTFADNLSSSATETSVSDIAVFDSRGGRQVWKVVLTPAGAGSPNEWKVSIKDQTGAEVGSSRLRFAGSVVDPATSQITINNAPDGAEPLVVNLDFSRATSFSAASSTLRASSVDGNGVGTLTKVAVNATGNIELTYSNGKTQTAGAVALADFRDPQQLERVGDGLFRNRAGFDPRLLASAIDGMGTLIAKQLEASNVDLSQQFGDLILIQRGFQASSQVVSVSNDMIQQLFGIRGQG